MLQSQSSKNTTGGETIRITLLSGVEVEISVLARDVAIEFPTRLSPRQLLEFIGNRQDLELITVAVIEPEPAGIERLENHRFSEPGSALRYLEAGLSANEPTTSMLIGFYPIGLQGQYSWTVDEGGGAMASFTYHHYYPEDVLLVLACTARLEVLDALPDLMPHVARLSGHLS